jgi:hypothetical protein
MGQEDGLEFKKVCDAATSLKEPYIGLKVGGY